MTTFRISSQGFYELIIFPVFADLTPAKFPDSANLQEWTLMDGVVSSRPIIDIRSAQNITYRRDASCEIIYKKVGNANIRRISTEEIVAATQMCRNEFYQGCLKDWRANDQTFGNKILPFFLKAVNADLQSNAYFGDPTRTQNGAAQYSTTVFKGIFAWIKEYLATSVIPSGQSISIADGTNYATTPASAYNLIVAMYAAQPLLMYNMVESEKAFYVSKEIARGYEQYLISIGLNANGQALIIDGVPRLAYLGIPIIEMPTWTPIISELKGGAGYAAILTIRRNFVFATDSSYGDGEDGKTALEVWYERKESTFYYRWFYKAGTQLAMPEYTVIALSSFS